MVTPAQVKAHSREPDMVSQTFLQAYLTREAFLRANMYFYIIQMFCHQGRWQVA